MYTLARLMHNNNTKQTCKIQFNSISQVQCREKIHATLIRNVEFVLDFYEVVYVTSFFITDF